MFGSLSVEEMQSPGCLIACAKNATDPYYNSLGVRKAHIGLDRLGLGLAAPGGLAEDLAIVLDSLVNAFLGGKPHLDQFEECNTSLRDGPRGHQGG